MTKRKHAHGSPPKGFYPHPDGGYIHHGKRTPDNPIIITAHMKAQPDTKKLALAVTEVARSLDRRSDG